MTAKRYGVFIEMPDSGELVAVPNSGADDPDRRWDAHERAGWTPKEQEILTRFAPLWWPK